jgi:hypothetical protein
MPLVATVGSVRLGVDTRKEASTATVHLAAIGGNIGPACCIGYRSQETNAWRATVSILE